MSAIRLRLRGYLGQECLSITMKQQPRFGVVGWIATRIHHLLLPVDALRLSTLRGTFSICWGDETLNMIVSIFECSKSLRIDEVRGLFSSL
uniref:Uncharacterized protein n=1 Tax=Candidatus Kentrum sp. UNK TaxID=2126344 RepID=A0A451A6D3_9GAMM|nr:MAG: hypothetical protein BECKUNK1418G_GA0071005_101816 [Candidatus Kentron sp. UNK]VFK70463.1 MAG: hypothetical protein BECKUNK1418H_GA0071006_102924 [Candidatus Kentron sp. UNK]